MSTKLRTALLMNIFCLICLSILSSEMVFAQKPDSSINSIRSKRINKTPQIKVNIPTYKPRYNLGVIQYSDLVSAKTVANSTPAKAEKVLTVLKVYPNPVDDQVSLLLRMDKESNLSVKIMDLLGNEVVTLSNERIPSGEQTKSYTIPNRLNTGIYFLKIAAGAETVVKRISVL
ncbi:T9SS type A sorting domain-containing protein [Pedobacter sp. GR22-6]|uniref:T9SS type A sorting domain-containing protein n=1 Tax=Pedobacter sp. GR22-6 TaxID=3127957 RepID=UPI00307D773B